MSQQIVFHASFIKETKVLTKAVLEPSLLLEIRTTE